MPYTPFCIQVWQALRATLAADFNAELEAVGQAPMPDTGFLVRDPQLLMGESLVVFYDSTQRQALAKYWVDSVLLFAIHMKTIQPNDLDLNLRLLYMEFAATQALQKNNTLGGLLRTLEVGDTMPWPTGKNQQGLACDALFLPVACQPDRRVANPERSIP